MYRPGAGGSASNGYSSNQRPMNRYGYTDAYAFQEQNDEKASALSSRISALKEVSLNIQEELTYQNRMLNEMDDDFNKTGGVLGATMRRLQIMARTQSGSWMWMLMIFVVTVFVYIYLFRWRN